MGTASYALPVGVLAALAISGLVLICWFFPRYYKKGVKADQEEIDAARRARGLAQLNALGQSVDGGEAGKFVPVPRANIPPVTPY